MMDAGTRTTLHTCRRSAGVTLVELVITIVIIGIGMAGLAAAFASLVGRGADPLDQTRAVALAQLYMDEIITKSFAHSSPIGGGAVAACAISGAETGETRATFNDVDDYHGINQQVPTGPTGLLSGYGNFRVTVEVGCTNADLGVEAKRINLTVRTPSAQNFIFSAYRVNF